MYVSNQGVDDHQTIAMPLDWKCCILVSCAVISEAMKDAEKELIKDPYSFGPSSRFLMNHPTSCAERIPSFLPVWLDVLGIDLEFFTDWIADRLDAIAADLIKMPNVTAIHSVPDVTDDPDEYHPILKELFATLPVHNVPGRERIRGRRADPLAVDQLVLVA